MSEENVSDRPPRMNKKQKRSAVLWGLAFIVLAFVLIRVYPRYSYLLPWNARTVHGTIELTAADLPDALEQGDVILRAKVVSITKNQFDEETATIYALIGLDVQEVLRGDNIPLGTGLNTLQYGGKHRNVTMVYPQTVSFELNEEYLLIMNRKFNPVAEPYARLVLRDGRYYDANGQGYTLDEIRGMLTGEKSPAAD